MECLVRPLAIQWLRDADMAHTCGHTLTHGLPLRKDKRTYGLQLGEVGISHILSQLLAINLQPPLPHLHPAIPALPCGTTISRSMEPPPSFPPSVSGHHNSSTNWLGQTKQAQVYRRTLNRKRRIRNFKCPSLVYLAASRQATSKLNFSKVHK